MTASVVVHTVLAGALGYAVGRLHQWLRGDWDRDEAYRDGYDTAARSTFSLAARMVGGRRTRDVARGAATVVSTAADPAVPPADGDAPAAEPGRRSRRGRHFVPDELVRAATYRLTPDRVARAKVVPGAAGDPQPADPGAASDPKPADPGAGRTSVPRPRSS